MVAYCSLRACLHDASFPSQFHTCLLHGNSLNNPGRGRFCQGWHPCGFTRRGSCWPKPEGYERFGKDGWRKPEGYELSIYKIISASCRLPAILLPHATVVPRRRAENRSYPTWFCHAFLKIVHDPVVIAILGGGPVACKGESPFSARPVYRTRSNGPKARRRARARETGHEARPDRAVGGRHARRPRRERL